MITIIHKPFNSPLLPPPINIYNNKKHNAHSFSQFRKSPRQRRRFGVQACSSTVLPLLPFPIDQVLVPSEAKTLHLYEARYISLLEESLFQRNKLFVHFVLDQVGFSFTQVEASFVARYGCLVVIEKVERLSIGALVLIRGVGRVEILKFKQLEKNVTMVRSKVRYELIADERIRRETFKKRKAGFLKKLTELKTLCDIEACAIVTNGDGTQSEVWPSPSEASRVVEKFRGLPTTSQTSHMVDQVGFLQQNLSRLSSNLEKETKKSQSLEMELGLSEALNNDVVGVPSSDDSTAMLRLLDRKIRMVDRKIAEIEHSGPTMVAGEQEIENEPHPEEGNQISE